MGAKQSTFVALTPQLPKSFEQADQDASSQPDPAKQKRIEERRKLLRRLPDKLTPSAGVFGSGLPGLLTARELALRGFDVTVIEQDPQLAHGSSRHAIGVWSAHHDYVMSPWVMKITRAFLRSFRQTSEFIAFDTSFNRVTDMKTWRWLYHRMFTTHLNPVLVNDAMGGLLRRNSEVMNQLLEDHPELAATVINRFSRDVRKESAAIENDTASGNEGIVDVLRDDVTVVDTPRFLDELVAILKSEYGINFKTHRRFIDFQMRLAFEKESVAHANVKFTPSKDDEQAPAVESHCYDLFVLATGGKTLEATWRPYVVPVIDFGGYSFDIPPEHPLASAFKVPAGMAGKDGAIRWGPIRDPTGRSSDLWWRVTGLMSPRRYEAASLSPVWTYHYLLRQAVESLRDRQGHENDLVLPEDRAWDEAALSNTRTNFYSRGFATDGLPVVSRLADAFNGYVIAGFGDDVFSQAAGAADLLGRMIVKDAPADESNIFTMWRFKTIGPMQPEPDERTWQDRLVEKEVRWGLMSKKSVQPLINQGLRAVGILPPLLNDDDDEVIAQRLMGPEAPYQRRMRLKEARKRRREQEVAAEKATDAEATSDTERVAQS